MSLLVTDLAKSYGTVPALRGIDLALERGVVALLGPNGSGKSTLLRCLASSLRPDDGEILWKGQRLWPDPRFLRADLGYLPQELEFPHDMTAAQLLEHLGRLKGRYDPEESAALLVRLGLGAIADSPFAALSAGQVRLVGIAQALLGDPTLLLLDEPTRGLDVEERERLFRQLRRLAPRGLILFSTQIVDDVPQVAQRVVVLKEGRVAYAGGAEALRRCAQGQVHELHLAPGAEAPLPGDCSISRRVEGEAGTRLRIVGSPPGDRPTVEVEPTLEEGYLSLLRDRH
jgi:ABC-type multidrug transport system ATPase subunit